MHARWADTLQFAHRMATAGAELVGSGRARLMRLQHVVIQRIGGTRLEKKGKQLQTFVRPDSAVQGARGVCLRGGMGQVHFGDVAIRSTKWAYKNRDAYHVFLRSMGSDPSVVGDTGMFVDSPLPTPSSTSSGTEPTTDT